MAQENERLTSPKISIIVPVYNVERYLRRCLDSIAAQTFTNWECILVDDGSPDGSGAICDEYAARDARFRVIHQQNEGVSAARNAGLDAARGEWIGFVDSDDWIEQETYEISFRTALSENADIVLFGVWDEYNSKRKTFCPKLPKDKDGLLKNFAKFPNYFNYPVNKLYRKHLLDKSGVLFPMGIKICEDLFFNFCAFFSATSIFQVKDSFYHYNHCNESSAMNNYSYKYFEDKCWVAEHIEQFLIEKSESEHNQMIIMFYKLYAKLVLILYPQLRDSSVWRKTYPEANKYIWRVPLRFDYKILSQLCAWGFFNCAYFLQDLKKRK